MSTIGEHLDMADFEAFVNHLHVDDVLDDTSGTEALVQTMAYAVCLGDDLARSYAEEQFEIIVEVGDSLHRQIRQGPNGSARDGSRTISRAFEGEAVMTLLVPATY